MILTSIAITSGAGAVLFKVYRDLKRKKKAELKQGRCNNQGGLGRIIGQVSSSVSRIQTTSQALVQEVMAAYVGDTRRQQLQKIVTSPGPNNKISAKEKTSRKNIAIASGSLALATGGLFYAPLYLLSALCTIYLFKYIYQTAYQAVSKRHINADVLIAIVITGALAQGFILVTALGAWYTMLMQRLSLKTKSDLKNSLINLFGEQPRFVWALVDGLEVELPFESLQLGDLIVVTAGQTIPVDGIITAGQASIDQHMLTGEAQPLDAEAGKSVFASTVVLSGKIILKVDKTGKETVAAKIAETLNRTIDLKLPIQSKVEKFNDQMVLPMLSLSGLTWLWLDINSALAILWNYPGYRTLVFAPMSMLNFLHLSSRNGILIKDARALEKLNDVDTIVFDKTGTLTLETPHVSQIYSYNGLSEDELLIYAAAAEYRQSHPIAKAILATADARQLCVPEIDQAHYEVGYGIKVSLDHQVIRVGSERFLEMSGIAIPTHFKEQHSSAQGHSVVMVAIDETFSGAIELQPTIRPEAKEIIQDLHQRGKTLVIISGDHEAPTRLLAEELGIDHYFANTLPENKANIIIELQQEGRTVCFVGDGINDAIALKQADVSISLCGATTIATDTALMILMDGNLKQLTKLFTLAQEFKNNMNSIIVMTLLPQVILIGGTLFLHWGLVTTIVTNQLCWIPQLAWLFRPLHKHKGENGTLSNEN